MLRATLALYVRPIIGTSFRSYRRKQKDSFNRDAQAGFRRQFEGMNEYEPKEKYEPVEIDTDINHEANVFDLDKSYDEHKKETALRKEQRKYYTIRQKYFKTPQSPNMLTWAEKEQIRNLYKEHPEEWTAESLSDAFPATKDIIIKVMHAKWAPANLKAVERHDRKVKENWQLFKENKLENVTPELHEHLKRFSNRSFDTAENAYVKPTVDQIEFKFPKPKSQEFSKIITSLQLVQQKQNAIGQKEQAERLNAEEHKLLESRDDSESTFQENRHEMQKASHIQLRKKDFHRPMTFDELMERSSKKEEKPTHLSIDLAQPEALQTTDEAKEITQKNEIEETAVAIDIDQFSKLPAKRGDSKEVENDEGAIQKFETKSVRLSKFKEQYSSLECAYRIRIPSKVREFGKVYQKNDAFYDHNGVLLYRVPGLEGGELEEVM